MQLDGKIAAITGGTAGIGRAIAEAFLAQGARVVVIESHAATQYVYTADNQTVGKAIGALTVVIGTTKRQDVAPTFDHRQDVNVLYWRRKGHAYAIVGQAEPGYMWNLVNDIAYQLDAI